MKIRVGTIVLSWVNVVSGGSHSEVFAISDGLFCGVCVRCILIVLVGRRGNRWSVGEL